MLWHEGFVTEAARGGYSGKSYTSYHDYQADLDKIDRANSADRPRGTYTKTKAKFTYDDGTSFERRVDLGPNDYQPRKEYIGHYLKKQSRTGKLVKVPKSIDNISGKKWVASDPPEYRLSDTGRPIDYGAGGSPRYTTTLNRRAGGATVSAHKNGDAYQFMNRTQAEKHAQKVGGEVYKPAFLRVYYVKVKPDEGSYMSSPASRRSSNGPGAGWWGEPGRHAEAARLGHRRRR